jgi:cyclopropane fatty-acyl-phospholipid synthase-like methyltransferase
MTKTESDHHSHQHGYHHRFDDIERWTKKFDDPARDQWQKPNEVIEKLHIEATDKVADIGAGTGYFSLRIAQKYPAATVYAADVEDSMVAYLRKQTKQRALPNHMPIKVSAHEPNLPDKVNLVLFVDTCHHIDDRTDYFATLKKRLLPDGRVAIIDFTENSPEGPPREHRIPPADMKTAMREAGYVLDQEISLLPNQYFLIFKPDGSN